MQVDQADFIWGCEDIARAINRSPRQTYNLLSTGRLPGARVVARRWVISKKALLAALEGPPPPAEEGHSQ